MSKRIAVIVLIVLAVLAVFFLLKKQKGNTPAPENMLMIQPKERVRHHAPPAAHNATVAGTSRPGTRPVRSFPNPETQVPHQDKLAPQLLTILGLSTEKEYQQRLDAVHTLPGSLQPFEIEALLWFIDSKFADQSDLDNLTFNALKNDTVEALMRQPKMPAELGKYLVSMFRNKAHDLIWRNYCVQFFPAYYAKRWSAKAPIQNEPDRLDMEKAFQEALTETSTHIAGTALLGLERLSATYANFDRVHLAGTALSLAKDEKVNIQTRIGAIQVCGAMKVDAFLPTARVLAQTGDNAAMRLAAIGTLGLIGVLPDRELLTSLAADKNLYTQKAAQNALKTLNGRMK